MVEWVDSNVSCHENKMIREIGSFISVVVIVALFKFGL